MATPIWVQPYAPIVPMDKENSHSNIDGDYMHDFMGVTTAVRTHQKWPPEAPFKE